EVWSALASRDLVDQGGQDHVGIAHDAEVGDVEDGGAGVLVDGDDGARPLHAGAVLDGAGDAAREVQLRGDGLAGLPHLEVVSVPAQVGGRARGRHRTTHRVRATLQEDAHLRRV